MSDKKKNLNNSTDCNLQNWTEKTEKLKSTIIGRLIGNAVPVKLAEAIGYTIKNHIKYSCS